MHGEWMGIVKLSPKGANTAPRKVRSNTVQVGERASAEYSVLPDWVDPDGDAITVTSALADTDGDGYGNGYGYGYGDGNGYG